MDETGLVAYLTAHAGFGLLGALLAKEWKHRDPRAWFFIAFFLSLIGLAILACMPVAEEWRPNPNVAPELPPESTFRANGGTPPRPLD